ncbi:MAG: sulfite exporter TauE/SafE family protein [Pseudomonadota bacterium]
MDLITGILATVGPLPLIIIGGFGIGFLVGMTGVGAGALTTPMLISGFGIAPAIAVGTDLVFAALTKASAAWRHHRLGNVQWRILLLLAAGSLTATLATLGVLAADLIDPTQLATSIKTLLAGALVISAVAIPLFPLLVRGRDHDDAGGHEVQARPIVTVCFGLLLGVMVTLTSVGAGAIGVAVLTLLYPRMLARRIVGTDIVHAIPLAALSGLGHLSMGNVEFGLLGALLAGSIPGILLGSRLIGIIPEWLLRLILSVVLFYAAYLLASKSW